MQIKKEIKSILIATLTFLMFLSFTVNLYEANAYTFDEKTLVSNSEIQTLPYSAVGLIIATFPNGKTSMGTGFIVMNHDVVATAAHCVYHKYDGGYAKSVKFFPGRTGTQAYFGSATATSKKILVPDEYIKNAPSKDGTGTLAVRQYDYAGIKLNRNISREAGQLPITYNKKDAINASDIDIIGYPLPSENNKKMYKSHGYVTELSSDQIYCAADIDHGSSGSPIVIKKPYGYRVIGIVSSGIGDDEVGACRATYDMSHLLDEVDEFSN